MGHNIKISQFKDFEQLKSEVIPMLHETVHDTTSISAKHYESLTLFPGSKTPIYHDYRHPVS